MNSLHLSEFYFGTIKLVSKNENDMEFEKNDFTPPVDSRVV